MGIAPKNNQLQDDLKELGARVADGKKKSAFERIDSVNSIDEPSPQDTKFKKKVDQSKFNQGDSNKDEDSFDNNEPMFNKGRKKKQKTLPK